MASNNPHSGKDLSFCSGLAPPKTASSSKKTLGRAPGSTASCLLGLTWQEAKRHTGKHDTKPKSPEEVQQEKDAGETGWSMTTQNHSTKALRFNPDHR